MNADSQTIDATILDLMLRAGSRWVLWVLIGLSLAAVAVMLERLWFFMQERRPDRQLAAALTALREHGAKDALGKLAGARSMEAAVARACLERAGDGAAAVDEKRVAIVEQERARYEKRLAFLGTLGNNAPFIGLFGTVLGIIRSFHDLSGGTMQNTQAASGYSSRCPQSRRTTRSSVTSRPRRPLPRYSRTRSSLTSRRPPRPARRPRWPAERGGAASSRRSTSLRSSTSCSCC